MRIEDGMGKSKTERLVVDFWRYLPISSYYGDINIKQNRKSAANILKFDVMAYIMAQYTISLNHYCHFSEKLDDKNGRKDQKLHMLRLGSEKPHYNGILTILQ